MPSGFFWSVHGYTLTSDPVSIRYLVCVWRSVMYRRHGPGLPSLVAINDRPPGFPGMCRVVYTSWLLLRSACDSSRCHPSAVFYSASCFGNDFVLCLVLFVIPWRGPTSALRVATCLVSASICAAQGSLAIAAGVVSVARTRARLFTSCIRSACSATFSSSSSFLVAKMTCVVGGNRPSQCVRSISFDTAVPARVAKWRRNCEGFRSPSSSLSSSCRIRCS